GEAVVAGERELEAAAERRTFDGHHHGLTTRGDLVEHRLAEARELLRLLGGAHLLDHLQLRPGDEAAPLARRNEDRADALVRLERGPEALDLLAQRLGDRVDGLVGVVEHDVGYAALEPLHAQQPVVGFSHGSLHHARSRTTAAASPPAAQRVTRPNCPPRRRSSLRVLRTISPPGAAKGCPSATEPPLTLSLSSSTAPTGSERPSFSAAKRRECQAWRIESTTAAKASCTSTTSMSASFIPARSRARGVAIAGPMSICSLGSTAA